MSDAAQFGSGQLNTMFLAAFLLAVAAYWSTEEFDPVNASTESGRDKAQALVAAYAKHAGAHDAVHQKLDKENDCSFGDFGFHYDSAKDLLQGRVLIVRSHIRDWPEGAASERQTIAGLNDPKIGGIYDRG